MLKKTLITVKDSNAVSGLRYKRVPCNWKERFLKWRGWQPTGIALLVSPRNTHGGPVDLEAAWNQEIKHIKKVFHFE